MNITQSDRHNTRNAVENTSLFGPGYELLVFIISLIIIVRGENKTAERCAQKKNDRFDGTPTRKCHIAQR